MNLAYRDIRHNLGRFLLTCFGLSLLLGVVLSMIGIYRGLVEDALTLVRTPAVDVWVVESGTRGPFAESSRIPGDTREAIARLQGVSEAGSITYQSIETRHEGMKLRLYVVGFEPGRPGGPDRIVAGRTIARSHYEMLADKRTGLQPGDRVALGRDTFTVVGLTDGQVSSGGDPVIYITLKDSQQLQFELAPPAARREIARGNGPGNTDTVNAIVARVQPDANPENVVNAVQRWKHLAAMTQEGQEIILTRSVVERARKQIGLFTSILLVVSAVIIALILYTMTMDKIREIATLKLIGAPDRTIIGLILQQALGMGVIGFGFGALLITTFKDYFPRRVVLQPEDGLALAAAVIVVCVISSGLGVRLALKIDPATALGG
ncbi:MAG: ABC transporter permease [Porticoccus sp.]|jgi:putative ABC transport system permease protein|uniref:ABC transporter permease n=1 Tax=Porticoccus hydrocarbonoclasticus TaxID=1073414 RepID=UPI000C599A83|nr:ABC transporter permease [Porticoccus hydrocarbonoclasticus]MBG58068.1 ABC transporter permease [Porticoccus sp.]|tara:strand:- start:83876 stop:85009 length:1134 start_codon:yes stop_codon:yes gene_type:complete